jgi:hypothetical protein
MFNLFDAAYAAILVVRCVEDALLVAVAQRVLAEAFAKSPI